MKYYFWIITIPLLTWPSEKKPIKIDPIQNIKQTGTFARPAYKRQRSCEDLRKYIKSVYWDKELREGKKEKDV